MRKFALLMVVAALLLSVIPALAQANQTIPEVLANDANGRFDTLLAAVEAAGLVDVLSGDGPFTVLAPTDDAFAAALEYLGMSERELLADTELLTEVLTYHVLPDRYFFRTLTSGPSIATVQGDEVQFNLERGVFTVNGQRIRDVDNVASNGIVHVVEGVLLPPAIAEAAAANRARYRFAHFSVDAGPVDIYIDGELGDLQGVTFGTVSDWVEVASGSIRFGVTPAGTEPRRTQVGRIPPGGNITIAVLGQRSTNDLITVFLQEDFSPLPENRARVSVFHAIQNAPGVDILLNGAPLIINLNYPRTVGDNDGFDIRNVVAGRVELAVNAHGTDTTLLSSTRVLEAGVNYLIVAAGTPTNPSLLVFPTPVQSN